MEIKEIQKEIHKTSIEKGFYDTPTNIGEKLMLIVSELGEACEAHRRKKFASGNLLSPSIEDFENGIKDTFEDELADSMIRIMDLAEFMNIDLEWHIRAKVDYNKTRPYKHGKQY